MNGDNVSMETKQEAYQEALATQNEVDSAKAIYDQTVGRHRNVLKKWKKLGVDPDHVTYALKSRFDENIVRDERGKLEMVGVAHRMPDLPRHIFPDLFAPEADTSVAEEGAILRTYDNGVVAGRTGRSADENPFEAGTMAHVKFHEGWLAGQESLAEEMVPTGQQEDWPPDYTLGNESDPPADEVQVTDANGSYVEQLQAEDDDPAAMADSYAEGAPEAPKPARKPRKSAKRRTASELFGA
jgi:hypothetical protein